MIIVDTALKARHENRNPIRVGIISATADMHVPSDSFCHWFVSPYGGQWRLDGTRIPRILGTVITPLPPLAGWKKGRDADTSRLFNFKAILPSTDITCR